MGRRRQGSTGIAFAAAVSGGSRRPRRRRPARSACRLDTLGRNCWTMKGLRARPNSSTSAPRLLPSASMRNTALPPLPCSGLDDDGAVARLKILHRVKIARDHRRRGIAEIEHENLFGRVTHRNRIIDHQRLAPECVRAARYCKIAEVSGGSRRSARHRHRGRGRSSRDRRSGNARRPHA